jgi:hypothetical protein
MDIATGVFEIGSFLLLEGFWLVRILRKNLD